MDCICLFAAAIAHALGGAACRGGEQDVFAHLARQVDDSLEDCCLSGAGAAGNDANLVGGGEADRFALRRVETELMFAFPVDKLTLKTVSGQFVFAEASLDDFGDVLFCVFKWREKAVVAMELDAARFADALSSKFKSS